MQMWMSAIIPEIILGDSLVELIERMGFVASSTFGSIGATNLYGLSLDCRNTIYSSDANQTAKLNDLLARLDFELELIKKMCEEEEIEWCLPVFYHKEINSYLFDDLKDFKWLTIYLIHKPDCKPDFPRKNYKNVKFITTTTWKVLDIINPPVGFPKKTRSEAMSQLEMELSKNPAKVKKYNKIYRSIFED